MKCYRSKRYIGLAWLYYLLMVGISYYCTTSPDFAARLVGWFCIFFFGTALVAIPIRVMRSGDEAVIELNDEAIIISGKAFRWNDIQEISVRESFKGWIQISSYLCLELTSPQTYVSQLSIVGKLFALMSSVFGYPLVAVSFSAMNPSLDDALKFIRSRHPEKFV